VRVLLPMGCQSFEDTPWDLVEALGQAQRILHWYENLEAEKIPPPWMWIFSEPLNEWFKELEFKTKRDQKDPNDDREQVPLYENEDPRMVAYRRGK